MKNIDLHQYRWVIVNSSGGKDSQTSLRYIVQLAGLQSYPLDQIVVSHQCLGEAEWEGTKSLAKEQAEHYGLRFEVSKYRNKDHEEKSLLDYVERRGMWPSSTTRFCTSDFKRGPGRRIITGLYRESAGDVLNVFGFRAEESPARAKRERFSRNEDMTTQSRKVDDYLPIHDWLEDKVWQNIHASGVSYHPAYDLGMPRLSCVFCIFAPKPALMIAGKANPELLDKYCEVESKINHSFRKDLSLNDVRDEIRKGNTPEMEALTGAWNM